MKYRKLVENAKKPNGFWGKMMIKAMKPLTDFAQLLPTARFTESTIPNSR